MKRLNCWGSTLEACTTSQGPIVGPLLTEVVGAEELTPYRGGWCGNEIFPGTFSQEIHDKARECTFQFGEAVDIEANVRLVITNLGSNPLD